MLRIFLVIDDYNELIYLQSLLKKLGFDVEGLQNPKKYTDVSLGFNPQILITTAKGKKVDGLSLARGIAKRRGIPKIIALRSAGENILPNELDDAGVDQVLDSPINPKKLILCIANLGGVDEAVLLDKYQRVKANQTITDEDAQEIILVEDDSQTADDIQRIKAALNTGQKQSEEMHIVTGDVRFPLDGGAHQNKAGADAAAAPVTVAEAHASEASTPESPRQDRFDHWVKEVGQLPPGHFKRDRILDFNKKIRDLGSTPDIKEIESDRKDFVRALFKNKK